MIALFIAAAITSPQQPGRDPALLHRHVEQLVAEKEQEQEQSLRSLLALGGSPVEHAEVLARLAGLLRARGLSVSLQAQAESDEGNEAAGAADKARATAARVEAIARYRELLKKFPDAGRTDEALFFLADTLQDSGRDEEAVQSARELVRRFPRSKWAPASHVFIGEHLFETAKLDEALKEYRAAAEVPSDEVYPYALYKAAWCRFNQSAFADAMKLLKRVNDVSAEAERGGVRAGGQSAVNTVQLAREARRDYVLSYGRIGVPETAHDDFVKNFGKEAALKMLEQYGTLLFNTGRDPEAQLIARQLLALHGDHPAAALDQTRLLVLAQRTGKRKDLLTQAKLLVETFQRVRKDLGGAGAPGAALQDEKYTEANQLGEETLRNLAVQIHNEARKTDLDETWSAARALYSDYLTLFPEAADAYDLRFFFGELLYGRNFKPQAAEQYEQVVKLDLARPKAPGKWLQKAAWSAVLSRNETVFGEQKETRETAQQRLQRKLTPEEQNLAAACSLYLQALPDGPHAVEVAFKIGRLEYISGALDAAQQHLAGIALQHPENELAEYAANLVLDISNLRKDWKSLHAWALKFLGDKRLTAHGSLLGDLKRIEEESGYAVADAESSDVKKAEALSAFVAEHPHGELADKALFGAAAALSRAGRIEEALAARSRVWKEQPQSPLVPRALMASAADLSAVGDLGEAAALLEKYAQGFQKQEATKKWRREHPAKNPTKPAPSLYAEAQAQGALHDAAVLREARGELRQALQDRALTMQIWKNAGDHEEALFAQSQLRARLGETARAAREFASLARAAKTPPLRLRSWREAARLYGKAHETGNAQWSWTEVERTYRALGPKAREKLPPEAVAAVAEAHYALGATGFETFKKQPIKAPLMVTLNRKIALLQQVKKRVEETVGMRQAEPAVCALARLGEAQILLGQALAQSPYPPGLNGEQRKLYRAALTEKAQPIFVEAKDALLTADGQARQLGVTGACPAHVQALLEKVNARPAARPQLPETAAPVAEAPQMVDARAVGGEKAKRLLEEALAADGKLPVAQSVAKFQAAAGAEGAPGAALFDLAIALDQAGRAAEAEQAYRGAAQVKGAIGYDAAARLAALSASRGDAPAARAAVSLAEAAFPGMAGKVLRAQVELALGNPAAAQAAAKVALQKNPLDAGALAALARAQLAQGYPGVAKLLAGRAAQADPQDAEPLLIQVEVARAAHDPASELAAARAAAETDPDSPQTALALGRALFERGQTQEGLERLDAAVELDPTSYAARLTLGEALAADDDAEEAEVSLTQAAALSPKAAEPHLALARLKLDDDGDAQGALTEAKLFLTLSTTPPPSGHPIHALVQRCEEALRQRAQASVVQ